LSTKLLLTTNNSAISKLLFTAIKELANGNVTTSVTKENVGTWLHKNMKRGKMGPQARVEEEKGIDTFISSLAPGLTFFMCEDRFLFRVLRFCSSEIAVLTDVIPDFHHRFNFSDQCKLFLNTVKFPNESLEKFLKYHTACPQAALMQQELPPKPPGFPGHYLIWTGNVKQFLKNIFNRRNFESENCISNRLAFGLLQAVKRGCAPVPDSFLEAELISHVKAMVTPPTHEGHWETILDPNNTDDFEPFSSRGVPLLDTRKYIRVFVDPVKDTFSSTCKAIMRNTRRPYRPKPFEPSHNSCFEKVRKDGGAYMQLVHELKLPLVESEEIYAKGKIVKNLGFQLPDIQDAIQICRDRYLEKNADAEIMRELMKFGKKFKDYKKLDKHAENKSLLEEVPESWLDNEIIRTTPKTAVVPLSEPLKVRVITKGECLPAYVSKSLQKSMKSYIDRFPSLVLTTRPLKQDDFRNVWKLEKDLETKFDIKLEFTEHVSGDYKAATDKLNIGLTKLIFEEFLEALNVPMEDRDVYREVLYAQRLFYPKTQSEFLANHPETSKYNVPGIGVTSCGNKFEAFTVIQQNGQLMGSILSFPVLCIANLICYKCALDEYINLNRKKGQPKRHVNVFDLPVLVNGDDIYFRSNPIFYKIWMKYIEIAGFQLSVGKNYVHKKIFTINSQCFTYIESTDTIRETTFLNVGLLIGQSKSGIVGEKLPTWDLYNKVTSGAYNKVQAHNRFLYYHKDSIAQISKNGNYNLFLPKILGGLGFVRPSPEIPVEITAFQRQLATYFHNKISLAYHKPTLACDLKLSQAVLIDEHSPIAYDPYQGEPVLQFIKKGEEMPVGFNYPNKLDKPEHLMIHHTEDHFEPKLKFRSIASSVLRDFRKSDAIKYKGKECWFGFEKSVTGNYPFEVVQSEEFDKESFEENMRNLIVKGVLEDILDSHFGPASEETVLDWLTEMQGRSEDLRPQVERDDVIVTDPLTTF